MGSYDGREVCEFVRLYLLNKLTPLIGTKNIGLYRDDGLAVIHQVNGPKMDRIRKDVITLFKSEGLSITIDTNVTETDFLDVSCNLEMDKFFPYSKPNNTPLYIHSESNHPPSVIKQLSSMTSKRISNLSCNEHEFNKAKPLYKSAMKSSGFNYSMEFEARVENARRNRNRNHIVQSMIQFKFKDKHWQNVSKACNLNTIKISYSSMSSLKNLIKQHNSKILNKDQDKIQRPCNCRIKKSCPLNGKCLHQCMVYKAEVSTNTTYKEYYGTSEGEFKSRYNNHLQSLKLLKKPAFVAISKDFSIKWNKVLSVAEEKLVRLLLSESEKVIGKLEAGIKVKIQEDWQNNIQNTSLEKLEPKHSKFKERLSQARQEVEKSERKKSIAVRNLLHAEREGKKQRGKE